MYTYFKGTVLLIMRYSTTSLPFFYHIDCLFHDAMTQFQKIWSHAAGGTVTRDGTK